MAALSVVSESDMSETLTNSSSAQSPRSLSHGSSNTSQTTSPLIRNPPVLQQSTQPSVTNLSNDVSGWPCLARLLAKEPELEAYSRFRELNVKNLLYYQVELTMLRDDLAELELRDCRRREMSGGAKYTESAEHMISISTQSSPSPKDRKQWDLVLKIRHLLKDYNAALLQHAKVSALPEPDYRNVESVRKWIRRPEFGNYSIKGCGSDAWGVPFGPEEDRKGLMQRTGRLLRSIFWPPRAPPNKLDLLTTRPRQNVDGLTRWVAREWVPFYHHCINPSNEPNARHVEVPSMLEPLVMGEKEEGKEEEGSKIFESLEKYSERTMLKFTSSITTVVACVLPTLSIGVLATVHGMKHMLLYIGGFTAIFSIGLMILTNASRVEIFTATAAFSAVLVVFVQNQ